MEDFDLRGLKCPLPTLKTRKRLRAMTAGERLIVLADDPMAAIDIPHFCRESGHALVSMERRDGLLRFEITVGSQPNR